MRTSVVVVVVVGVVVVIVAATGALNDDTDASFFLEGERKERIMSSVDLFIAPIKKKSPYPCDGNLHLFYVTLRCSIPSGSVPSSP